MHNATQNKGSKKAKRKKSSYYRSHQEELKPILLKYAANFKPDRHTPHEIYDGIRRKKRTILVPSLREQVIHHMIVNIIKPIIMKPMYRHAYGSLPGRGATKGKQKHSYGCKEAIEQFIHKYPEDCQYCLKLDIKKFFDNIPHKELKQMFARIIKDKRFLEIIYKVIDSNNKDIGLPIGFYTSQWFANFYLIGLDHYIKEQLHARSYYRYMDDMVIFDKNKKILHLMHLKIQQYLNNILRLQLNNKWQVFNFNKRFLDFVGFRFYINRTILRHGLMLRMTRKARRLAHRIIQTAYECRQMLSYKGWLTPTNTYNMYKKYIKPFVSFNALSHRISWADKLRRIQYVVS